MDDPASIASSSDKRLCGRIVEAMKDHLPCLPENFFEHPEEARKLVSGLGVPPATELVVSNYGCPNVHLRVLAHMWQLHIVIVGPLEPDRPCVVGHGRKERVLSATDRCHHLTHINDHGKIVHFNVPECTQRLQVLRRWAKDSVDSDPPVVVRINGGAGVCPQFVFHVSHVCPRSTFHVMCVSSVQVAPCHTCALR